VSFKLSNFFIWDGKTRDFGLNNNKHSLNLICSWSHHEGNSDLLRNPDGPQKVRIATAATSEHPTRPRH
jgi:hypothetical protein